MQIMSPIAILIYVCRCCGYFPNFNKNSLRHDESPPERSAQVRPNRPQERLLLRLLHQLHLQPGPGLQTGHPRKLHQGHNGHQLIAVDHPAADPVRLTQDRLPQDRPATDKQPHEQQ